MDKNRISKFQGLLGIARKAGKIVPGTERVRDSIRNGGEIKIVFIASDVSDNTKKRVVNCCDYYGTGYRTLGIDSESLGNAVGSGICACIGVIDKRFAKALLDLLDDAGVS